MIKKRIVVCPVCGDDAVRTKFYSVYKSGRKEWEETQEDCPRCSYQYRTRISSVFACETICFVVSDRLTTAVDERTAERVFERLVRYNQRRKEVLEEGRKLMADNEFVKLRTRFLFQNSNKNHLKQTILEYLRQNREKYPNNYRAYRRAIRSGKED